MTDAVRPSLDEMIERTARKLRTDYEESHRGTVTLRWDGLPPYAQDAYRDDAKRAIGRMLGNDYVCFD